MTIWSWMSASYPGGPPGASSEMPPMRCFTPSGPNWMTTRTIGAVGTGWPVPTTTRGTAAGRGRRCGPRCGCTRTNEQDITDRPPHPSPVWQETFEAALSGATDPEIEGVDVVRRSALGVSVPTCWKRRATCWAAQPTRDIAAVRSNIIYAITRLLSDNRG